MSDDSQFVLFTKRRFLPYFLTQFSGAFMVRDIVELPGNFRVRLSSINPMEIDSDLIRLIAETEKLCSHLHIPLQSGDDAILKAMRRNYNRSQYLEVVQRAITAIPGLGLGADVMCF